RPLLADARRGVVAEQLLRNRLERERRRELVHLGRRGVAPEARQLEQFGVPRGLAVHVLNGAATHDDLDVVLLVEHRLDLGSTHEPITDVGSHWSQIDPLAHAERVLGDHRSRLLFFTHDQPPIVLSHATASAVSCWSQPRPTYLFVLVKRPYVT